MPYVWRTFRPALLVILLLSVLFPLTPAATSYAQDGGEPQPVSIQGTFERDLPQLIEAIRDAYTATDDTADVQIGLDGQAQGFSALCAGNADIVVSSEPISDSQRALCNNQDMAFVETVVAYEAVVLLAPADSGVTCLSEKQVFDTWSSDALAEITWADFQTTPVEGAGDTPLTFYGPSDATSVYALFEQLVPSGSLRDNIVPPVDDDVANILAVLKGETDASETPINAVGFMSLADYNALDPDRALAPIDVQDADSTCIAPTQGTVESGAYPLALPVYLYVAAPRDDAGTPAVRPEVEAFVQFALMDDAGARAVAADQGYTVPLDTTFEYVSNNVRDVKVGRTLTRASTPVTIATDAPGAVSIAGTSLMADLTAPLTSSFRSQYPNAAITVETLGNSAGWTTFCEGVTTTAEDGTETVTYPDVLQATRFDPEAAAACEEAGIEWTEVALGYDGLVFVVPAGNDWIEADDQCLTTDQLQILLAAGTDETPAAATWQDVNPDWPDVELMLVAPPLSEGTTDYLTFNAFQKLNYAVRQDLIIDDDPFYRVQGVANTGKQIEDGDTVIEPLYNGLTYLWWSELQGFEASDETPITVLSLAAPDGTCVTPGASSFAGEGGVRYPLSHSVRYYVSQQALANNPMVRAFLWHLYSQAALDQYAAQSLAGFDADRMVDERDALFNELAAYEEQPAAEDDAEADAPADEADTPADDAASDETPADEAPADDAAGDDAPADEAPADDGEGASD